MFQKYDVGHNKCLIMIGTANAVYLIKTGINSWTIVDIYINTR